jgi:predicted RND superfamily exporter protein
MCTHIRNTFSKNLKERKNVIFISHTLSLFSGFQVQQLKSTKNFENRFTVHFQGNKS